MKREERDALIESIILYKNSENKERKSLIKACIVNYLKLVIPENIHPSVKMAATLSTLLNKSVLEESEIVIHVIDGYKDEGLPFIQSHKLMSKEERDKSEEDWGVSVPYNIFQEAIMVGSLEKTLFDKNPFEEK